MTQQYGCDKTMPRLKITVNATEWIERDADGAWRWIDTYLDNQRGRESFLDKIAVVSVEDLPCCAANVHVGVQRAQTKS